MQHQHVYVYQCFESGSSEAVVFECQRQAVL